MRTRLIRIGNSRGLRLSKSLIEKARLKDEVEVTVGDRAIVITAAEHPRAGWDSAVQLLIARQEALS